MTEALCSCQTATWITDSPPKKHLLATAEALKSSRKKQCAGATTEKIAAPAQEFSKSRESLFCGLAHGIILRLSQ